MIETTVPVVSIGTRRHQAYDLDRGRLAQGGVVFAAHAGASRDGLRTNDLLVLTQAGASGYPLGRYVVREVTPHSARLSLDEGPH